MGYRLNDSPIDILRSLNDTSGRYIKHPFRTCGTRGRL